MNTVFQFRIFQDDYVSCDQYQIIYINEPRIFNRCLPELSFYVPSATFSRKYPGWFFGPGVYPRFTQDLPGVLPGVYPGFTRGRYLPVLGVHVS